MAFDVIKSEGKFEVKQEVPYNDIKGRNDRPVIYFPDTSGSAYEQGVILKSLSKAKGPKESKTGPTEDEN